MKEPSYLKSIVFAHRGIYDNKSIPENSIKAFKRALNQEIPIELDVHLTRDDQVVVFHDDCLKRMAGIDRKIKECTYSELMQFSLLKTSEKIPLLLDILKLINGRVLINIEIKNDGRVGKIGQLLTQLLDSYHGKFIIQSFYPQYIIWFKKHRSNYTRGLLITKKGNLYDLLIKSKFFLKSILDLDFIACRKDMVSSYKIQRLRKEGLVLFAFTIRTFREREEISSFADSYISEFF